MGWRGETIFCDDIRIENTGKHILIGVYGVDLLPSFLPVNVTLGAWVRFSGLEKGQKRYSLRLKGPSGSEVLSLDGETEILRSDDPTIFSLLPVPVNIDQTGSITLEFGFDGEPCVEIGRLRVSPPQDFQDS